MFKKLSKGQLEEFYIKLLCLIMTVVVLVTSIILFFNLINNSTIKMNSSDASSELSNMAEVGNNLYCGKNLLRDYKKWNDVEYTTSQYDHELINIGYLEPNTTYTFSAILESFSHVTSVWLSVTINNKSIQLYDRDTTIGTLKVITFMTPSVINNAYIILGRQINGAVKRSFKYSNLMLEVGSIPTSHEPYFTNDQTINFKNVDFNLTDLHLKKYSAQGLFFSQVNLSESIKKDTLKAHSFLIFEFSKNLFINHLYTYSISLFVSGFDQDFNLKSNEDNYFKILLKEDNPIIIIKYITPNGSIPGNQPVNISTDNIKSSIKMLIHHYPYDDIKAGEDFNKGYEKGHDKGYDKGYDKGFSSATNNWGDLFPNLFGGIAGFFKNVLDVQVFGTSLLGLVATFGAILIALAIIKMVTSK